MAHSNLNGLASVTKFIRIELSSVWMRTVELHLIWIQKKMILAYLESRGNLILNSDSIYLKSKGLKLGMSLNLGWCMRRKQSFGRCRRLYSMWCTGSLLLLEGWSKRRGEYRFCALTKGYLCVMKIGGHKTILEMGKLFVKMKHQIGTYLCLIIAFKGLRTLNLRIRTLQKQGSLSRSQISMMESRWSVFQFLKLLLTIHLADTFWAAGPKSTEWCSVQSIWMDRKY